MARLKAKSIIKWLLWYAVIILVLILTDSHVRLSAAHYFGIFISIIIIDLTYSERHIMTKADEEDEKEE